MSIEAGFFLLAALFAFIVPLLVITFVDNPIWLVYVVAAVVTWVVIKCVHAYLKG